MAMWRGEKANAGNAWLHRLHRAFVTGGAASALLVYQSELHRLLNELTGRATWLGIAIVPALAVVLGILAVALFAAALRRLARWLTALKHSAS